MGNWTDIQIDNAVKKFAKLSGWNPSAGKQGNVASAIGFLERKYKVNYDQRYDADVNNLYILPCSVHELILVPVSTYVSSDYLREVVQEVNEESVLPEERLSDSVYYFSRESGMVQVAGD